MAVVRAVSVMSRDVERIAVRDTVMLDHRERREPSALHTGLRGTKIRFALPAGTRLMHDDRVVLDDGSAVEIVARPERLLEVRAPDLANLARAAWLLGDHHIPAEIHPRYVRVLQTAETGNLLATLAVTVREIEAPFEPEGGAYLHEMPVTA
ncbi:urease accessory protein UreE [Pseudorhodoplanes sp.]|uniref:urease accessory protein UreE n=1 Tax=Pseudorhodoplanes sp. TaxID=1934341 RepID=UPI00391DD70D